MPRISANPITLAEIQAAKRSNMELDQVAGMEELLGEDGIFEEFGASQTEDLSSYYACCCEEFDKAQNYGVNDIELIQDVSTERG